jgi:hypothetical protein
MSSPLGWKRRFDDPTPQANPGNRKSQGELEQAHSKFACTKCREPVLLDVTKLRRQIRGIEDAHKKLADTLRKGWSK